MFAFLGRRKSASDAADAEVVAKNLSAAAKRRKRVFDRTVMTPDVVVPEPDVRPTRNSFGLKPSDE